MDKIIKITHFKNYKNPFYVWAMQNSSGGSFTNSGQYSSWKKCVSHARELVGWRTPIFTVEEDGGRGKLIAEKSSVGVSYPSWAS